MSTYSRYSKEIYKELGLRPTWLPGTVVELGDVGLIEDGVLKVQTSLARLGIPFEVTTDKDPDGELTYQSKGSVAVTLKVEGETNEKFRSIAAAEAGALVEFNEADAVLMQLDDVRHRRVADQAALRRALLDAIVAADDQKRWLRDWVVVTEVVDVGSGTIVISGGRSSRLELRAKANLASSSLADVGAGLAAVASDHVSTRIVAQRGLTPLYNALRVRRNFWWLYDEVVTATGEIPVADEVFGVADPGEEEDA